MTPDRFLVARDFGIPAVVCPHATRLLQSGDRVRVDGNRGRISLIDSRRRAGIARDKPGR